VLVGRIETLAKDKAIEQTAWIAEASETRTTTGNRPTMV